MLTPSTWRASSTALMTSTLFFCLVVSNRASKNIPPESPVQNSDQVRQALLKTTCPQPICPRPATIAQDNDLPARFSLDHRDNAARLVFRGGEPLDVGEGTVTRIYVKTGERWDGPTDLMTVKALVTYRIAHLRPDDPDTKTSEEEIRVKSTVGGTITKILVREGQRIHHNHLLATMHKE